MNIIEILKQRGFIEQTTHEHELIDYVDNKPARCYIGFDPTAESLHIGSLVPIMALVQMQKNGHIPIALVGGGTGLIGDPSGKVEMRKVLTEETIANNAIGIKNQLSRFMAFNDNKAFLVNNSEWLTGLSYINFLRDIGRYFSVNRMIKAESYKMRLESEEGLSFLEFNYMLLQAYDFLELSKKYDCFLQMGGSDQWGNIVAGIDLIRRVTGKSAFGVTFPLITTSSGNKMGKTEKGAVWLDPDKTSPYEYYQYWVNIDDRDLKRFLLLFTFLPYNEVEAIDMTKSQVINASKTILAYDATNIAHGREEAENAYRSSIEMFGHREISASLLPSSSIHKIQAGNDSSAIPATEIESSRIAGGIPLFILLNEIGLTKSRSESKRLIAQGGAYINNERVFDTDYSISANDFSDKEAILRAGKKKYHKLCILD